MNRLFDVIKNKFGGWVNVGEFAVFVTDHEFETAVPCEAERISILETITPARYVVVAGGYNLVLDGGLHQDFMEFLSTDAEYQERLKNTKPVKCEIY